MSILLEQLGKVDKKYYVPHLHIEVIGFPKTHEDFVRLVSKNLDKFKLASERSNTICLLWRYSSRNITSIVRELRYVSNTPSGEVFCFTFDYEETHYVIPEYSALNTSNQFSTLENIIQNLSKLSESL